MSGMLEILSRVGGYVIPLVLCLVGWCLLRGKRTSFDAFGEGAREGLACAVRLCPTLLALLPAIRMLRASGATELIGRWMAPLFAKVGVPSELLPLLLTRPFSGGAAMASYESLLQEVGADSFVALCASVIMGSSDTVVYVLSVYFSAVGVKRTRYAFPVALAVMLFCIFFSCFICRLCLNGA